jgi:RNA polymerase sigma factor (sigma-70 family)
MGSLKVMPPSLAQPLRADRSFERLYRRHVGDVYRYSLALLREPADAEDVTQTTFRNASRAYERGERPGDARNWLITIAHNICRHRSRQPARRHVEHGVEDEPPAEGDVQRALGRLAFDQRAALVMRELEGRSYAQIAEILGLSLNGVETLLFDARRALREQLEGSLTCHQAERAISRRADFRLPRAERSALRAHLRECEECARFAGSEREQREAFKALAAVPVPSSLTSLFGAEGAIAGGLALKAGALVAAGLLATGVSHEASRADKPSAVPSRAHAEQARPHAAGAPAGERAVA